MGNTHGRACDLLTEIRDLLRDRPPERLYPRCATCARPVDRDHKDACELADGKGWVCSEACWEEFAAKCDRPPERGDEVLDIEATIAHVLRQPNDLIYGTKESVVGRLREIARLRAEVERITRNLDDSDDWATHWKGRAEKAEAERDREVKRRTEAQALAARLMGERDRARRSRDQVTLERDEAQTTLTMLLDRLKKPTPDGMGWHDPVTSAKLLIAHVERVEAERDRLREERIGLRRWAEARDDGAALAGIRAILATAPEPDEDGGDDE